MQEFVGAKFPVLAVTEITVISGPVPAAAVPGMRCKSLDRCVDEEISVNYMFIY